MPPFPGHQLGAPCERLSSISTRARLGFGGHFIPSWPFNLRWFKVRESRELQRMHKAPAGGQGSASVTTPGYICLEEGVPFANWHRGAAWGSSSPASLVLSFFLKDRK